jgi:pimeloyl-ACP methyl ester carboxylesterase
MPKEKMPCPDQVSVPRQAVTGQAGSDHLVIELPSGGSLGFAGFGDPGGVPYGLSKMPRAAGLWDWPRAVSALADHLGVGRFAVLAHSLGSAFALACGPRRGRSAVRLRARH